MEEFSRKCVVKYLEGRGFTPLDDCYRPEIEKYILLHFDLMAEELASPKKFRDYCVKLASKVKECLFVDTL